MSTERTEELLTIQETADLLRLKVSTIYKMVCQRRIPFAKYSGKLRFPRDSIVAWVESHTVAPAGGGRKEPVGG